MDDIWVDEVACACTSPGSPGGTEEEKCISALPEVLYKYRVMPFPESIPWKHLKCWGYPKKKKIEKKKKLSVCVHRVFFYATPCV